MKPPPPKNDGDWVTVIYYNEGQVTEFEKSTVKVKCVLKTQDYLRAVSVLTTEADGSSIPEENFEFSERTATFNHKEIRMH